MKIVMINDCAFIGETLLKYIPPEIEKDHIRRSRNLWSKTFGLAYKISKAKGDLYHVHYLLQDCYIAARLGKRPLIGHAHGSDLREKVKSRKWGQIVKYDLKKCDKILVSQPTIVDMAKQFNESAEYFPIPYDPKIFFPKPLVAVRDKKKVLIASAHDFAIKGTDKFLYALASLETPLIVKTVRLGRDWMKAQELAKKLHLELEFFEKVTHEKMNTLYWESDLVLGSFGVGQLDTVAIEAMACGRLTVHSIYKEYFPECPLERLETTEQASEVISKLLFDEKAIKQRIGNQLEYVTATHSAPVSVKRLMNIYKALAS
jgi:glycosyltransferase involved in cell wall biosynthesis